MTIMHLAFIFMLKADCQTPETTPGPPGSHSIECATNFIIKKFEGGKDLKVVVSGPSGSDLEKIKYEAVNPSHIKNVTQYVWQLGDGGSGSFNDYWHLADPTMALRGSLANIPYSSLPISNEDFGDRHGVIKVEASNPSAEAYSNDPSPNGSNLPNVKVFFRKDDLNLHQPNVPNWFYYWKNIVESQGLNSYTGIKLAKVNEYPDPPGYVLNNDTTAPDTPVITYSNQGDFKYNPQASNKKYGENSHNGNIITTKRTGRIITDVLGNTKIENVGIGYPSITIVLGESNGFEKEILVPTENGSVIKLKGIQAFSNTFFHELHHAELYFILWKNGYVNSDDFDEDFIPDKFERQNTKFNFKLNVKDNPYSGNYDFKNLKAASSIDYYEEFTVREFALLHINDLDDFDWSYDPSGNFQGINWNKK